MDAASPEAVEIARRNHCQVGMVAPGSPELGVDLISLAVDGSPASVERARELAGALPAWVRLQVEGDLDHESVRAYYDAGATLIVVGAAIFGREDLPRAYRRLVQALA